MLRIVDISTHLLLGTTYTLEGDPYYVYLGQISQLNRRNLDDMVKLRIQLGRAALEKCLNLKTRALGHFVTSVMTYDYET